MAVPPPSSSPKPRSPVPLPPWAVRRVRAGLLATRPGPGRHVVDDLSIRTGLSRRLVARCLIELRAIDTQHVDPSRAR